MAIIIGLYNYGTLLQGSVLQANVVIGTFQGRKLKMDTIFIDGGLYAVECRAADESGSGSPSLR